MNSLKPESSLLSATNPPPMATTAAARHSQTQISKLRSNEQDRAWTSNSGPFKHARYTRDARHRQPAARMLPCLLETREPMQTRQDITHELTLRDALNL